MILSCRESRGISKLKIKNAKCKKAILCFELVETN
jgi:hypothetical protein